MSRSSALRSILALCVVAACPVAAVADGTVVHGGSAAQAHPEAHGGGPADGTRLQIDERFTREIGDGCQYLETVQGTLVARAASAGTLFSPDLHVDARIECERQPGAVLPPRTVHATGLDARALEALVESRATMQTPPHAGEVCTFVPDFVVAAGTLRGQSIARSCAIRDEGGSTATPDAGSQPGR